MHHHGNTTAQRDRNRTLGTFNEALSKIKDVLALVVGQPSQFTLPDSLMYTGCQLIDMLTDDCEQWGNVQVS